MHNARGWACFAMTSVEAITTRKNKVLQSIFVVTRYHYRIQAVRENNLRVLLQSFYGTRAAGCLRYLNINLS